MHVLTDKCILNKTMFELNKDTISQLTEYCKTQSISTLLNIKPDCVTELPEDFIYILKGSAVLYLPFYTHCGNFKLLQSLFCSGNIFLCNKKLFVIKDNGAIQEYNAKVADSVPHINGVFGYDDNLNPITRIYPVVITDGVAHYHILYHRDTSTVQINPELPPRYLITDYQETLIGIARSIEPRSFPKVTQLSADVILEIDTKGGI